MGEEKPDGIEMKDLTSTSFGYIIAFLLPGLSGLYALSYWSPGVKELLQPALRADATVGPSLILILVALGIGLFVSGLRFFMFEKFLCRAHHFPRDMFKRLAGENKLVSFRAVVDEHYRYHQFYGGCVVSTAVLYFGWLRSNARLSSGLLWITLLFLAFEAVLIRIATDAFVRYVERGNIVLNG
jgi:hypothetical protein